MKNSCKNCEKKDKQIVTMTNLFNDASKKIAEQKNIIQQAVQLMKKAIEEDPSFKYRFGSNSFINFVKKNKPKRKK